MKKKHEAELKKCKNDQLVLRATAKKPEQVLDYFGLKPEEIKRLVKTRGKSVTGKSFSNYMGIRAKYFPVFYDGKLKNSLNSTSGSVEFITLNKNSYTSSGHQYLPKSQMIFRAFS